MSEPIHPKFRKTKSDTWAVMAPVETLEKALEGDGKVQVLKKSGDFSEFTVASLGKAFDVDGVQMCYGYDSKEETDNPTTTSSGPQRSTPAPQKPKSVSAEPPPADPMEPLPEYQGGAEDEYNPGIF